MSNTGTIAITTGGRFLFIKELPLHFQRFAPNKDPEMHHFGKETLKKLNQIQDPTSTQNPHSEDLKWLIFFVVTGIAGIVLGHSIFLRNQSTEHFPAF